jgi:hypothetical protein
LTFWLSKTGSEGTLFSHKKIKTAKNQLKTQFIAGPIHLACLSQGLNPFKRRKINPSTPDQAPHQYSDKDLN